MTGYTCSLVADTQNALGESPLWCAAAQSLLWTDITGRRLHKLDLRTGDVRDWSLSLAVGAVGPARHGGLVAATEHGFAHIANHDDADPRLTPIAPVLAEQADLRFNDGRCDRQGRFWASSMRWSPDVDRPTGQLWALDRGTTRAVVSDLVIGNGLAWSPDGRTMYLADSARSRAVVWAYDFSIDDGVPTNRRVFIDMKGSGGRPDGATIDTDGCYWSAATDAGEVRRYTPEGRLDLTIQVPVPHPTMPAFGGPDLKTLFVTSLRTPGAPPHAPDGGVFAVDVRQQGMIEESYIA